MASKVLIPISTFGHDPTEVAVPYTTFVEAGLTVHFATPDGSTFTCDPKMLNGITGMLLGANAASKMAHNAMMSNTDESPGSVRKPLAWKSADFDMTEYDIVFLPGGHAKGVRELMDSTEIRAHLQKFFPLTSRSGEGKKVLGAICHGVQVLSETPDPNAGEGKSIIHACTTTALPGFMETGIFNTTRLFLGDYYKTYGPESPNVEDYVKKSLDDPEKQFKTGPSMISGKMGEPFVVVDDKWRYVSGRFPPDSAAVTKKCVEELKAVVGEW